MTIKTLLGFLFFLFVISSLVLYWFVPFQQIEFGTESSHTNFSLNNSKLETMQFYSNMRFPTQQISYNIFNCPLNKKEDMVRAFEIISNKTILEFYSVGFNEEIFITCDSKNKIEGGLFIAGEGGPTNITKTENFNVILKGKILLIKESKCGTPTIALHELLHVLGFEHSLNKNNIMYNVTSCRQTIGEDILESINNLYSTPSYPDLTFENVSASIHGRYLDTTINVRNNGLGGSDKTSIFILANDKPIKEILLSPLEIGYGINISISNVWVSVINIRKLDFIIDSDFEELEKNNNRISLEIDE